MALNIAFQLDHPSRLNAFHDTSLLLAREAAKRGHRIFYLPPASVSAHGSGIFGALAEMRVHAIEDIPAVSLAAAKVTNLAEMDVVLIRQNPPFDMAYISNCLLLETLERLGVRVLNKPASVRSHIEKLIPLRFAEFAPPTLISSDIEQIRTFYHQHGEVVIKPLYAYGGKGVFKLTRDGTNAEALLEMMLSQSREPLVVQKFLPEVMADEQRIILIDGRIAGHYGRVPVGGEIRANTRVGGDVITSTLSQRQRDICAQIGAFARAEGMMLVGLDVIGDWLTEVNITSPTGLLTLKRLYNTTPEVDFWDAVEAGR